MVVPDDRQACSEACSSSSSSTKQEALGTTQVPAAAGHHPGAALHTPRCQARGPGARLIAGRLGLTCASTCASRRPTASRSPNWWFNGPAAGASTARLGSRRGLAGSMLIAGVSAGAIYRWEGKGSHQRVHVRSTPPWRCEFRPPRPLSLPSVDALITPGIATARTALCLCLIAHHRTAKLLRRAIAAVQQCTSKTGSPSTSRQWTCTRTTPSRPGSSPNTGTATAS